MKYLFFVQSEGRGHLTQALTVAAKLRKEGHLISRVIINSNPNREIPDFFRKEIACPIEFINSTYFLSNKNKTGINLPKSIVFNLFRFKTYFYSLKKINTIFKELEPDIILNFYEPLVGLFYFFFKPKINSFCFGHQFFLEHPSFIRPRGEKINHFLLSFYNSLVSYGSKNIIALSFTNEKDIDTKKMLVCPPLIRDSIKILKPENHNYVLSYLLNDGYCQEIIKWSQKFPNQRVEAFWDKKNVDLNTKFGKNLTFHLISGQLFIDFLKNCTSYASTAGFESICEAAYLQKDILMIPTANQYEQACNAIDAKRAGIAENNTHFDINLFQKKKDSSSEAKLSFKCWVDNNDAKIINAITNIN